MPFHKPRKTSAGARTWLKNESPGSAYRFRGREIGSENSALCLDVLDLSFDNLAFLMGHVCLHVDRLIEHPFHYAFHFFLRKRKLYLVANFHAVPPVASFFGVSVFTSVFISVFVSVFVSVLSSFFSCFGPFPPEEPEDDL